MDVFDLDRRVVGEYSDAVVAGYNGAAKPAEVGPAVKEAVDKLKVVMRRLTCPTMSIKAVTPGGVVFKVTIVRV